MTMQTMDPWRDELRRVVAELVGTAFLLAAIVGSGIVTQTDGSASAQLFQHTIVVGLALTALILTFGPVSGAHFNPVVTLVDAWFGGMPWSRVPGYLGAQVLGAVIGVAVTNVTFSLTAIDLATNDRGGVGLIVGEVIATLGLLLVIFGLVRSGGGQVVAGAAGAYIAAAIYFTSSASFANPAVTIARMLSDTYTGIAPIHAPGFLLGQLAGAGLGIALIAYLFAPAPAQAAAVVVPHAATNGHRPGAPQPHRAVEPAEHPEGDRS
jgi:glycerol uptake facilitator-like aquaporin